MSVTKTLFGTQHIIPEDEEHDWGDNVTDLLKQVIDDLNGTPQAITASGASTTIDFSNAKNARVALNASTTFTLSNPKGGRQSMIILAYGGSFTPSFPASVKWSSGGATPSWTSSNGKFDVVWLVYDSTSSIYRGRADLNYLA